LKNKLVIADISKLEEKIIPIGMFLIIDIFWDRIKQNKGEKKIIYIDEIWRLIGGTGNLETAEFIYKIFKTIRKYGGAATAITQDVSDFFSLEDGKYGKAVINNSALKFILQLEEEDIKILKHRYKIKDRSDQTRV
jgi:type IV secretory pathway VirB4 component